MRTGSAEWGIGLSEVEVMRLSQQPLVSTFVTNGITPNCTNACGRLHQLLTISCTGVGTTNQ